MQVTPVVGSPCTLWRKDLWGILVKAYCQAVNFAFSCASENATTPGPTIASSSGTCTCSPKVTWSSDTGEGAELRKSLRLRPQDRPNPPSFPHPQLSRPCLPLQLCHQRHLHAWQSLPRTRQQPNPMPKSALARPMVPGRKTYSRDRPRQERVWARGDHPEYQSHPHPPWPISISSYCVIALALIITSLFRDRTNLTKRMGRAQWGRGARASTAGRVEGGGGVIAQ